MKEKLEKIDEFLYEVNIEQIQEELKEDNHELRRSLDWLDISDMVDKFYDCDAGPRIINNRRIGAPAGYRPLNMDVKKVGFEDYPELLGYDREERNNRILEYVKLWVVYVGTEKLKELDPRVNHLKLRLNSEKGFVELVEEQKKKKRDMKEVFDEISDMKEKLRSKDRSGYEELSEEEKEKVDERAKELIEKWSGSVVEE